MRSQTAPSPSAPLAKRGLDLLHRLLNGLLALSVAVLMIPVMLQIFSRYVGFIPRYIWTEELARFCFIWMIMLGAMVGVREGTHFDADMLPDLPPRVNAALKIITHLAMLVMAAVFLYYGYRFAAFGANQTSELAELPMGYIFFAWPLAGLTWAIFLAERLLGDWNVLRGRGSS